MYSAINSAISLTEVKGNGLPVWKESIKVITHWQVGILEMVP